RFSALVRERFALGSEPSDVVAEGPDQFQ
ncbi:hypothetical protein PF70_03321, partial [Pseudomonas asplenii]